VAKSQTHFDKFKTVAESVAGKIGHEFLVRLVETLGDQIKAGLVAITQGEGRPPTRGRFLLWMAIMLPANCITH